MNRKFKIVCQNCGEEAVIFNSSHTGLISNSNIETKIEAENGDRIKAIIKCTKCCNYICIEDLYRMQ